MSACESVTDPDPSSLPAAIAAVAPSAASTNAASPSPASTSAGSTSSNPSASPRPAKTCEIRMLASPEDLVESYRLRYDVYNSLGYLQRFNAARLDIDEY